MRDHITMCPYCKHLFDVEVGDKFKSGEITTKWGDPKKGNNGNKIENTSRTI